FPNSLPSTPVVTAKVYGFANIEISWTFENKVYYQYEVYASKEANFTPNNFNLIHSGQISTYMYQAKPNETWYFKVCAINTHGNRTDFGSAYARTTKIDDLSNYVDEMAINEALIGTLSLDRGWVGTLKGNHIDAKNLSVTNGNGKRTLDIDSYGNVSLDVASLKISSSNVATENYTDTKATQALNDVKAYTTTEVSKTNSKVATIETNLNGITQKVSNVETTSTQTINLAKAMSNGKILHTDVAFRKGVNNVSVYNNSGNGTVTVSRIAKISDCPTTSTHCLEIKTTGTASPGNGGFYQRIQSRANAIFIQKFTAKVPSGLTLNVASNSMGTGYTDKWLTSNKGTGKWEEYIREVRCGSTGTFSNGGYVYVSGASPSSSSPLVWYLASCTTYDITDSDERVTDLTTRMSSAESKITDSAIINTVSSTIDSKVNTGINNIQVGGRNLLKNSKPVIENSNYGLCVYSIGDTSAMVEGEKYTVSFDGKLSDTSQTGFYINVCDAPYPALGNITRKGTDVNYHRYTITAILPKNTSYTKIGIYSLPLGNGKSSGVKNVKLEKGDKATDWTPAPEDVSSEIETKISSAKTEMKLTTDSISQRVSSTENTVNSNTSKISQLQVTANGISTEVSKKVNSDSIISTINQSAEAVAIKASKINLDGYVFVGTLLTAPHITGKTQLYMTEGSILSSDGSANFKNFYVMPNGQFSVEPSAYFSGNIHGHSNCYISKDLHVTGNTSVQGDLYVDNSRVLRSTTTDLFQVKYLGIQNTGSFWAKIITPEGKAFGVDIWESDIKLKENIELLNTNSTNLDIENIETIGLDLVNAIEHYSFDYNKESCIESNRVECGYIAQQLREVNPDLVRAIEQGDGSEVLSPRADIIIPYLSKAIQEQQRQINLLKKEIYLIKNATK
ncbi:MAG: tail fiber domain-containing protein, partial [Peptostreptococcaceae bacterium]|nr:tail fiber domain-containing protein [Peptostreptococcaceae bacterium]